MANLSFIDNQYVKPLSFFLARKDYTIIGAIHASDVKYKHSFNEPDEISFTVHRYKDGAYNTYWDRINNFNVLFVPELGDRGEYFEIEVNYDEGQDGTYKSITATGLAETELANTKLYDLEINTDFEMEYDPEWDAEYHTVFCRDLSEYERQMEALKAEMARDDIDTGAYAGYLSQYNFLLTDYKRMKHVSLLHRLLDKAENYKIKHVDETLYNLTDWYQFAIDDEDIYSVLTGDVAEQYHVWFKFDSVDRTVSAYDLYSVCQNDECDYRLDMKKRRNILTRYRGDFRDKCPYCGSTHVTNGYGKDTKILVSHDNLLSSATVSTNKDELKNCFRMEGGDDLMTAAIINQNPNGSAYIYQYSDEQLMEMPEDLVERLNDYNTEYQKYYKGDLEEDKGIYNLNHNFEVYVRTATPTHYEEIINNNKKPLSYYRSQYNDFIDFISGHFEEDTIGAWQKLDETCVGYQTLAEIYYNTLDIEEFVLDSMVPDVVTNNDSLEDTAAILTDPKNFGEIAVTDPTTSSISVVNSAIIQLAKCLCNTGVYDISIDEESDNTWIPAEDENGYGIWTGKFIIATIGYKNTIDERDHILYTEVVTTKVTGDECTYIKQSVQKLIDRKDAKIVSLFDTSDFDNPEKLNYNDRVANLNKFKTNLEHYSLNYLMNIVRPAYVDVQGVLLKASQDIQRIYNEYYLERRTAIDNAIAQREQQYIAILAIRRVLEQYREDTQSILNFASYLGEDLWKVFCNYRREDTYSNDHYVAEGLDNGEVIARAEDFIDQAQKELFKASHLQYEVSGNLYNLLNIPEFQPIMDEFEVGNWIHMQAMDKIYNLRLLSYEIDFNDQTELAVEFSTVEQLWSGASDIQSVLNAAGSIAGSYSSFAQQVRQNSAISKDVRSWVQEGLDATKIRYLNNPYTQEVTFDETGLWAKAYVDEEDRYKPGQLRILNSGLYTTSDSWNTIDAAIGAFTYYDPFSKHYIDDYGVIAKTVVGQLILGENLKIFNDDASLVMNDYGLEVTNNVNTFSVHPKSDRLLTMTAGNKTLLQLNDQGDLYVEGHINATSLTLGQNSTVTGLSTDKVTGIDNYLKKNVYVSSNGTVTTTKPTGDNVTYCGVNNNGLLEAQNAIIYGELHSTSGMVGGFTIKNGCLYTNNKILTTSTLNGVHLCADGIYLGPYSSTTKHCTFQVDNKGKLYATDGYFEGTINAAQGGNIAGWTILPANVSDKDDGRRIEFYDDNVEKWDFDGDGTKETGTVRCGIQALTKGTAVFYAGCKTAPGESIASSDSSKFFVTQQGHLYSYKATIENAVLSKVAITNGTLNNLTANALTVESGTFTGVTAENLKINTGMIFQNATIPNLTAIVMYERVQYGPMPNYVYTSDSGVKETSEPFVDLPPMFILDVHQVCCTDELYVEGKIEAPEIHTDHMHAKEILTPNIKLNTITHANTLALGSVTVTASDNSDYTPIGTTGSSSKGKVAVVRISKEGNVEVYGQSVENASSTPPVFGNYTSYTLASSTSDVRLKTNIKNTEVSSALNVINQIPLHSFDWKSTKQHQKIGMVADEIEAIDSDFVVGGGYDEEGNMNIKTINDFYLSGYFVKAFQEMTEEISYLQKEITDLRRQLNEYKED